MSTKPLTLTTPPSFQCYDCTGCGECCRGRFAIIISRADRDRIAGQQWDLPALGLDNGPLFLPRSGGFQLAHHADGSCIFLDADGRCRIHARFGESEKPLPCRLYPFRFIPLGSQVRVDVRFDCPATAGNFGRPIPGYRNALIGLMHQVVPHGAQNLPAPPLYGRVPATWAQLCRITESFERLITEETLDLTHRLLCAANLVELLHSPKIVSLEGRKLSEFLETVTMKVLATATDSPPRRDPPGSSVSLAFRQLLGVYGRIDQVGAKAQLIARLRQSLRIARGHGGVPPLRADFPAVTFADIETMSGVPANGAGAVAERYLRLRLTSMSFFGRAFYQRSYLDGLSSLLLTYPLACWFARVYALGSGLDTCQTAGMEKAIQIVDHQHGITPVLDFPSERYRMRFLGERENLRSLILWYGS